MGDKAVGEMEGGSGIRGRRIRERGELGEGHLWFWRVRKFGGRRRRKKGKRSFSEQFRLRTLTGTQLLLGIMGSGVRKPQEFWKLWSQRGCS
jgi:hypothetical protein